MASASTTLNGAINAGALALVVRDALDFPSSGTFKVWIDAEAITISAGAGTTSWTVARGSDGTTAASHLDGTAVYLIPAGYATINEVLDTFDDPPATAARLRRLTDLIGDASAELDMEVGNDFYQHGTITAPEVRTFHGTGRPSLCVHVGIVSLTALAIADSVGGSFTVIDPADYFTESLYPDPSQPYDHLTLRVGGAIRSTYPWLQRNVRLTGIFGFASIPTVVRAATIDRTRQRFAADPALIGSPIGPSEFGRPFVASQLPDTMYRVVRTYRGRFYCNV